MTEEDPALSPDPSLLNRQPKWFKPIFYGTIIVTISAVSIGLFFSIKTVLNRRAAADASEAASNSRSFSFALLEFETEYGGYPSPTTRPRVEKDFGTTIDLSGSSSNALFRQLYAANITQSEQIFYAKTKTKGWRIPDGIITPGNILKPGECGFSYISGLSSKDDPSTPIALTPLIPGTTKFDPKPFKGKAIILHIDNSVLTYEIQKDGHIHRDGINLLSPKHPVWKGKSPDIRYPEL